MRSSLEVAVKEEANIPDTLAYCTLKLGSVYQRSRLSLFPLSTLNRVIFTNSRLFINTDIGQIFDTI